MGECAVKTKIYFYILEILDNLFPVCRADLVVWAIGGKSLIEVDWSGKNCKPDGCYFEPKCGGCYCGKYRVENSNDYS